MFVWLWGKHENWNNKACKNLFLNNEAKEISISSELLFWKEKIREAGCSKYIWTVSKVTCDGSHKKHLHKELCFCRLAEKICDSWDHWFYQAFDSLGFPLSQHILTLVAGFITWNVQWTSFMFRLHYNFFLVTGGGWVCKILVALWGWM